MSEPQPIPSLADVLAAHSSYTEQSNYRLRCWCGADLGDIVNHGERAWTEHVEAAYWAARTVHTAKHLDALPIGSVVQSQEWCCLPQRHEWTKYRKGWRSSGDFVEAELDSLQAKIDVAKAFIGHPGNWGTLDGRGKLILSILDGDK